MTFNQVAIGQKFTVNYSGTGYVKVSDTHAEYCAGINDKKVNTGQRVRLDRFEQVNLAEFEL